MWKQKASFLVSCMFCGELGVASIKGAPQIYDIEQSPEDGRDVAVTLMYTGRVKLPQGWVGAFAAGDLVCSDCRIEYSLARHV